jgi:hypothetical protein
MTSLSPRIAESTAPELLRADPRARRTALVAVGLVAVAGAAAIQWLLPRLATLASTGTISRKSICIGFLVFLVAFVVPVVLAGIQNVRRGRDAVRTEQFPSPNTRVLVDTRVARGRSAVTLGRVQQVLGALLVIAALALLGVATFGIYTLW